MTCETLLRALGVKGFDNSDKTLSARLRAILRRYLVTDGLLYYSTGGEDTSRNSFSIPFGFHS
jgi:hypothetical protein